MIRLTDRQKSPIFRKMALRQILPIANLPHLSLSVLFDVSGFPADDGVCPFRPCRLSGGSPFCCSIIVCPVTGLSRHIE